MREMACANRLPGKLSMHNAVTTPPETPIFPNTLPYLAVFYAANPVIPPIQHKLLAK